MKINVTKTFTDMKDFKKKKSESVKEFKKNEEKSRENAINLLKNAPLELGRKDK